jgi:hypothetical protein
MLHHMATEVKSQEKATNAAKDNDKGKCEIKRDVIS